MRQRGFLGYWVLAGVVVLAVIAVAVVASGGSDKTPAAKARQRKAAVRKHLAEVRRWPLTGLPDKQGVSLKRPAVTVKINNTDQAKQYGVDQADVVYEEVVEGQYTRLAAIFNSHAPDRVGPVRSVRRTDQSIVWPIGGIFAYSGGAQYAIDSINTAPVKQLDETRAGPMMYRDPVGFQYMPLNLWAHVDQMYAAGGKPMPPPPLFKYRGAKAKLAGTAVKSFVVGFAAGFETTWDWDARTGTWLRSKFGGPDIDADNVRLAPQNVVVMSVQYAGGAGVEGAEAELTGTGNALVFTGGKEIKGTWSRPDKAKPAQLLTTSGAVIRLTPGQTWVELPDVSYSVTVTPPVKPAA
jgi:Protein of unknown function (DUF3048) N-terminal domain/Protein of unknown function (DUF3048) C-terminal domain